MQNGTGHRRLGHQRLDRIERALQLGHPPGPELSPLQAGRRDVIRAAASSGRLTPEVVAAYAALHLQTDDGRPIEPAPHHALWLRLLCDPAIRKLLILAPPESAKTSWVVGAFGGCHIGLFPERSIILVSASGEIAIKRSLMLRAATETRTWRATFSGVEPAQGLAWTANAWSLAPAGIPFPGRLHPTVSAYGTGGSITGSRADVLLVDDLLDFDNTRTDHQRSTVYHWVHNSLLPRLKAGVGRTIVIGTPWHPDDVYGELAAAGDWVVCKTPLYQPGTTVKAYISYPNDYEGHRLGEPVGG